MAKCYQLVIWKVAPARRAWHLALWSTGSWCSGQEGGSLMLENPTMIPNPALFVWARPYPRLSRAWEQREPWQLLGEGLRSGV